VIRGDEHSSARGPCGQEIDRTGLIAGLLAGSGVMNPHPTNGHHGPAVFVEPSARRGFFDSLRLPEPKETLSELVTEFDLRAASLLPDIDVPMSDLAMTEAGTINVPHQGAFTLTPWAKQQLASRLGVRWNRWFDGIDPKLRAGESPREPVRPGHPRGGVRALARGDRADGGRLRPDRPGAQSRWPVSSPPSNRPRSRRLPWRWQRPRPLQLLRRIAPTPPFVSPSETQALG
jgi:hypothetical protein